MTTTEPTIDDLAQFGFKLACDEVDEIMSGDDHITMGDMTACEMVALLTILRPARERKRLAQRQPAPVLTLVPRQVAENHIEEGCMTGHIAIDRLDPSARVGPPENDQPT
jgi:hypothetical protein